VWLVVTDLVTRRGRQRLSRRARPRPARPPSSSPTGTGATAEKYIPSIVTALAGNPANQILVVDNGSIDGSADFLRANFPQVTVLALPENLGFGGGSNAGFRAAKNDIVVLLNSDMRVAADFLAPLLEGFREPEVFAVSCQIFFSDPERTREETGLTQGWWQDGTLRVRHRIDDQVDDLFPCFYGCGGSCAFDRHKFLALGGFDPLLAPFYLEDTDLGYMAWKRGWKVLYQPRSVVFHEHRGTIGKKFSLNTSSPFSRRTTPVLLEEHSRMARLAGHFFAWSEPPAVLGDARCAPTSRRRWVGTTSAGGLLARRALELAAITDTEPSVPWAATGSLCHDGARADIEIGRAVRFTLPDLPAGARRRRLHVPDAARDGETG
jgi:GT2 family glycosyltransferase